MARSTYIYQLVDSALGETVGAFTVKHEMEAVRQRYQGPTYVVRYRDGVMDSGRFVDELQEDDQPERSVSGATRLDGRPHAAAVNTVAERLCRLLQGQLGVDEEEVVADASFVDDLGCDSLDVIEVVMAAEEEFGIEISNDEAERVSRVSDAIVYLQRRTGLA
jgi:acyl carrier protein